MPIAPKSMQDMEQSTFASDPSAVREQLSRLLVHPLFANSKRYPALLAYTVEQTLLGNASELKERSIGIEVFGRSPTYDANADPVVRITAGEVRKRLSIYYYDATHSGELIIELPIGSYVPLFRPPDAPAEPQFPLSEPEPIPPPSASAPQPAASSRWRLRWVPIFGLAALACGAGIGIGLRIHPPPPVEPPSNMERFWEPFISSASPTSFCLGEPAKNINMDSLDSFDAPVSPPAQPQQLYVRLHFSGNLALADVITLTRAAATLDVRHKSFRVVPASEASFAQLREGPIVLIGAFDNIWTLL
jgi:hypothetical protein